MERVERTDTLQHSKERNEMKLSNIQYTESMQSFIESLNPIQYTKLQEYINSRINQYNATSYDDGESNVTRFYVPNGTMIVEFVSYRNLNAFRIDFKRDPSFAEIMHNLKKAHEYFESFYQKTCQTDVENREIIYGKFNELIESDDFADGRGMSIGHGEFGITDIMDLMHNLYISLQSEIETAQLQAARRMEKMFIARIDTKLNHIFTERSDSECTT